MNVNAVLIREVARIFGNTVYARIGKYRSWPPKNLTLDEPLALKVAEAKTDRLRRMYSMATRDAWDGPTVFRDAMTKHGGIQLSREKREALAHLITMLMYGELAAWIVSAELTERLEDPDARMAASSQVFDEARHFYVLRDYLAALHVPVPELDPYFVTAVRILLNAKMLELKLAAMQLLAEGTAQTIFQFLVDSEIEPVLSEILPFVERDEARHIGLGVIHLPKLLEKLPPRQCRRIGARVAAIGDMFGATQIRYVEHYKTLGADPRKLFMRCDRLLHSLSTKIGTIPGTDQPYLRTMDPDAPGYAAKLDFVLPPDGEYKPAAKVLLKALDVGAMALA